LPAFVAGCLNWAFYLCEHDIDCYLQRFVSCVLLFWDSGQFGSGILALNRTILLTGLNRFASQVSSPAPVVVYRCRGLLPLAALPSACCAGSPADAVQWLLAVFITLIKTASCVRGALVAVTRAHMAFSFWRVRHSLLYSVALFALYGCLLHHPSSGLMVRGRAHAARNARTRSGHGALQHG
jgi:hypothetical protein